MNNKQPQQPMNLNIDPRTLPSMECDECGHGLFEIAFVLKRVSPILSGKPKEQYIPIDMFVCKKCGHLNTALDPFKNIEVAGESDAPKGAEPGSIIAP